MTDAEKDAIRATVAADTEKLASKIAKFYLGKTCPYKIGDIADRECDGPRCQIFLLHENEAGTHGGACGIALGITQIGPIANGLFQLANQISQSTPRVALAPSGAVRG